MLEPLVADTGLPWVEQDGVLVSVAVWIDGDNGILSPVPLSWGEFGQTLRAVHEHPAPTAARPVRVGIRRWSLPMSLLIADVDARLAQTSRSADHDHSADVADLWQEHRPRLTSLARVERRLKRSRTSVPRVPVHGDPHLGNVVVDGSRRPWLIDFDEATVAPREVDLVLIELGVIFSAPITDEQRAEFHDGYGPVDLDRDRILRFGCVRAIEDATATIQGLIDAAPDDRPDLHLLLAGQFAPDGLVSITERRLDESAPLVQSPSHTAPIHSTDLGGMNR